MRCERSTFWTKHYKTSSEQLCYLATSPSAAVQIQSNCVRTHLIESFLNPYRLCGFESSTNSVQIQSACVHTGGQVAIQIQSKLRNSLKTFKAGIAGPLFHNGRHFKYSFMCIQIISLSSLVSKRRLFWIADTRTPRWERLKLRLHTAINQSDFVSCRWMWFNGSPAKVYAIVNIAHSIFVTLVYVYTYKTCTKIRNRPD